MIPHCANDERLSAMVKVEKFGYGERSRNEQGIYIGRDALYVTAVIYGRWIRRRSQTIVS